MTFRRILMSALLCAGVLTTGPAKADELVVGLSAMAQSMDPHFRNSGTDVANLLHAFDKLILQDEEQQLIPGLATSWKQIDPLHWEIDLREGVTYHDGTPFVADDVVFTVERAATVPNSTSPFTTYTKTIAGIEVVNDHKLIIETPYPAPLLPLDLSTFGIVSRKHGEGATTEDYNSGKATFGTGPYKFVEFVPGERIVYEANPDYWGPKPEWSKLTFKLLAETASRVAALQAGDVNLINDVPADDAAKLAEDPNFNVTKSISNRVIYLIMDSERDVPINMTDNDGQEMAKNPLQDVRVRKAISLAINRQGIIDSILEGQGIASGQLVPEGFFGSIPGRPADAYDPDAAKALLSEAGYPDGFQMTIHGSKGRYYADDQGIQAIGQMLTRIGIKTAVEVVPRSNYTGGNTHDYSLALYGWGSDTGEASSPLTALLHTRDKEAGYGASNRGHYSNPELDKLIEDAKSVMDDGQRETALQEATEFAMNDYGIITLWFQVNAWASDKGIVYDPRRDEFTLAVSTHSE